MPATVVLRRDLPNGAERWLRFAAPRTIVRADALSEVVPALTEIERATAAGAWAAGFVAYEAAPAFDRALAAHPPGRAPLVWFAVCDAPRECDGPGAGAGGFALGEWTPSVDPLRYRRSIEAIRARIAAGDTYQVNYTLRLSATFDGDPRALFATLCRAQPSPYAACVDTGALALCSVSPELFFAAAKGEIVCRPMKGTARRGRWWAEDLAAARALAASEKDRAENVMIADMLRNDLGRIAEPGSVEPRAICAVERHPTVWQMTSTVAARSRAGLVEIFGALFPCASITGAPKVATSRIIRELEDGPRGVYCGAIGLVEPGGAARFSVAIRTVEIDRAGGRATYGVGGGVVWDSRADAEEREWQAKALVLAPPPPEFALLETILWRPRSGYALLPAHIGRLARSARYFGFRADPRRAWECLADAARTFPPRPQRVRLLVARDGAPRIEAADVGPRPVRQVALACAPVDSSDVFLFHKTTHRAVYDAARQGRPDVDDVVLWNERGELTETTIANLVLRLRDGGLVTPPVSSGLLAGTFRARLLARGRVREAVLTPDDLHRAERVYLVNAVRGVLRVELVPRMDGTAPFAENRPADR